MDMEKRFIVVHNRNINSPIHMADSEADLVLYMASMQFLTTSDNKVVFISTEAGGNKPRVFLANRMGDRTYSVPITSGEFEEKVLQKCKDDERVQTILVSLGLL